MTGVQIVPWSQRFGHSAIWLLVGAGAVVFCILALELSPLSWPRYAILMQLAALLIAFLLLRARPTQRLVIYPLLILCVLYLWDRTLPPPNFPEGFVRHVLARLFLIGLVADGVWLALGKRQPVPPTSETPANLIRLNSVARIRKTNPSELREHLRQLGWIVTITMDGEEYIPLEALTALLDHEVANQR